MSETTTFVSACLRGDAIITDVDDWVEAWHDAGGSPGNIRQSLADYLGLTPEEYALWVERPESLRFVLAAAHKPGMASDQVAEIAGLAAAAARADNDAEAAQVVHWLRETGRLR